MIKGQRRTSRNGLITLRAAACLVALLSGYRSFAGAAPSLPAAGPPFDGTYIGQNTLVRGWGFVCDRPIYQQTITIRGGRFDYPFAVSPPRTAPLPVQVDADGTLHGQMLYGTEVYGPSGLYMTAWVTLTGRITGSELDATITDQRCVRHLTARRQ